jgi:general secretion pathway protein E
LCAARDPLLPSLREAMRHAFPGRRVHWCLCRAQDLERMLDGLAHHARSDEWGGGDEQQLRAMAEEAPVVELVSNLMAQAVEQRASDIHLEPEERTFSVRFRIDGVLHNRLSLPRDRFDAVASRLKLISGMDIAERRLPQDGRLSTRVGGQEMDIRVSALPGVHGESIVMRLLPKERKELGLERLGFEADHLAMMKAWTAEANGIVLVTGPTGSGKSTTLYASLAAANDGLKKIITVEDPVEFQLPAITQIQAHPDIGLTFANALRSILRQDPDVIMIGEIRDLETAQIAVQAALTGHLVLSTLHTNDAISAFTRLIDMGVEPFLVATPVRAVQAQRLVRRLCTALRASACRARGDRCRSAAVRRTRAARTGTALDGGGGLFALHEHRLPRAPGHLRDGAGDRSDAAPDRQRRIGERDEEAGPRRRLPLPARGRPAEGVAGPDHGRGSAARRRHLSPACPVTTTTH